MIIVICMVDNAKGKKIKGKALDTFKKGLYDNHNLLPFSPVLPLLLLL